MDVLVNQDLVALTADQIELFHKMTTLQQNFCLLKLGGYNNVKAYIGAGGDAKSYDTQRSSASTMASNLNVHKFLTSFAIPKMNAAIMDRDEMLERLTAIARTNVGDLLNFVNYGEDMVSLETGEVISGQTYWALKEQSEMTAAGLSAITEMTKSKDGMKIKFHNQMVAMKQLAELQGFDADKTLNVREVKSLSDFYNDIAATGAQQPTTDT